MMAEDWDILAEEFGVRWDRVIEGNGMVAIYGWLDRKDGARDFVMLLYEGDTMRFFTSSAKYSKRISVALQTTGKHEPCQPFTEWLSKYNKLLNGGK